MPESMEETAACDVLSWTLLLCVKNALQHHGKSPRLAFTGRPTGHSPTHLTAHKATADGHQIILGNCREGVLVAGTTNVMSRDAGAGRGASETSSFRRCAARRRRPLRHCRRPGRCRPAMRRVQRPHWHPCLEAPLRPPWLTTAGDRFCALSAQMAPADHGIEHLVCGHTMENWSLRLIASSTLFVDA